MPKATVIFSGGPDSTAATLWALAEGYQVDLLTFQFSRIRQYGELKSAMDIAGLLKLPHTIFDVTSSMNYFSPFARPMMHAGIGHGDALSKEEHLMRFGAGWILSTAANYTLYKGHNIIIWGATKDDLASGNYQYSASFASDLATLITHAVGSSFSVLVPFASKHKYEIIGEYFVGKEDLFAATWSCTKGGAIQSGDCAASIGRRVAAHLAGLEDRTNYAVPELHWPERLGNKRALGDMTEDDLAHVMASPKPGTDRL